MSKTSKIFKCTCIYFRRTIQTKTKHGFSWGRYWPWRLWTMRRLRLRWTKLRQTREVAQIYEDAKRRHRKIMTGGLK